MHAYKRCLRSISTYNKVYYNNFGQDVNEKGWTYRLIIQSRMKCHTRASYDCRTMILLEFLNYERYWIWIINICFHKLQRLPKISFQMLQEEKHKCHLIWNIKLMNAMNLKWHIRKMEVWGTYVYLSCDVVADVVAFSLVLSYDIVIVAMVC